MGTRHQITAKQLQGNYHTLLASDGQKHLSAVLDIKDGGWSWEFRVSLKDDPTVTVTQNLAEAVRKYNSL